MNLITLNRPANNNSKTAFLAGNSAPLQGLVLLPLLLLATYAHAAPPLPAGYLIDADTRVEVGSHLIKPYAQLDNGTRLILGKSGHAIIYAPKTAAKYQLTGPGQYLVTLSGIQALNASKPPVRHAIPSILAVRPDPNMAMDQAGVTMRSANTSTLTPNNTIVNQHAVQLRWQSRPHKGAYRIRIENNAGDTIFEARTDKTVITTPRPVHFTPGEHYSWTLYWEDETLESESAQFVPVSEKQFYGLESLRKAGQTMHSDQALYKFLLMALLYKNTISHSSGQGY